jgi:hypothetical protein
MKKWSRTSCRTLRRNLSYIEFALGALIGVFRISIAASWATRWKLLPKDAIIVSNKVFRPLSKPGCFSKLLGCPFISWLPGNTEMDYFSRREFHDKESIKVTEKEINYRQKITSPNLISVIFKEGFPVLIRWPHRAHQLHIFANVAFRNTNINL